MEEAMTEEEFFEWLQNAMQSGKFENFATSGSTSESPPTRNPPKTGASNSSSASSKRKKKGKKQWWSHGSMFMDQRVHTTSI